ncbi:hypothetical protein B0T17DRAFT_494607 [Bombardia bombarda]|uniref:FAD-binding FR-type domain-containing protein n=1 Tax=Bombardia bombarda TaxID=252184 RepID=A0AA39WU69_9PEZI|nr:hypothetical protein B0T17DRAFT_494607 [Bombardia bombarda]
MPPSSRFPFHQLVRPRLTANVMSTQVVVAAALASIGAYAFYTRNYSGKPVFKSLGFHSLRLHSSELVSHNVKRLRFELPDANTPAGLPLTSALLTFSFPNGGWKPVLRPYTPVNDLDEPGFIELMVKHYPGGAQSTHIHSLKPGDKLSFMRIPGYNWTPNKHSHVALIAGGAGITPMYQLTRGILKNPDDKTRITLVWGVNTDDDIFLRDQFAAMERQFPGRFKAVYVVATPDAASSHPKGFVTKELLEKAGLSAKAGKDSDIKVLICGPEPMEKALKGAWRGKPGILSELGYTRDQIHNF